MKVRILPFLTTFTQLTARLKNFLRGWLLVLSLKEGLVECATVCVKSEVILSYILGRNGPIWVRCVVISVRCVVISFAFPVSSYVTNYVISYVTNMDISDSCHISCHIIKYLGGAGMKFMVIFAGLIVRCKLSPYLKRNYITVLRLSKYTFLSPLQNE